MKSLPRALRRLARTPGRLAHLRDQVPSDIWFEPAFTDGELDRFEGQFGDD